MDGQVTGKSFSSFQVNEALVARVVEAIKKGEADARRYGQLRSFEVYYDGYRERLVLGRIMIVPAKLADSPEDFPSALLYGAMMKEITPEEQADLYAFKLGDSEYDQYDDKALRVIKEKLFTDADGVLRSIIVFIPTWANVRDFIIFKMTRDWELLARMVRHQVFAAYFDPRFSSAFDQLASDTDKLSVSDITPKIDFPGLADGLAKSFPDLELAAEDKELDPQRPNLQPGDGLAKRASARKPIVLLAADNADDIAEKFLEPGEREVIDNLSAELKGRVEGEQEAPIEVADKQASAVTPKTAKYERKVWHESGIVRYELNKVGPLGHKKTITYGFAPDEEQAQGKIDKKLRELGAPVDSHEQARYPEHYPVTASVDDTGAETGLRDRPDYGESDSHTSEANELAAKGASAKKAIKELTAPGDSIEYCQRPERERCNDVDPQLCCGGGYDGACDCPDCHKTHPHIPFIQDRFNRVSSKAASLAIEGATLTINNGGFYAKAASGHVEKLRINGNQIKWVRPLQFTAAFRQSAETFVRNPRNRVAGVPQTFDEIWSEIAEEMGPAPAIELNRAPNTDGSSSSGSGSKPRTEKLHEMRGEDSEGKPNLPEAKTEGDDKPEGAENSKSDEGFQKFVKKKKEAKTAKVHGETIGKCAACQKGVIASTGSEVAPNHFLHAACQERAKRAAFDMFIPSQVAREFYPEVLQDVVDFPGGEVGDKDGHDPSIGLHGENSTGVYQSDQGIPGNGDAYVSTGPSQAMGIGNDGHPQILEGAPLRQENDIRGYQFDQEYYAQQQNLNPKAFVAAYAVQRINKQASPAEFQAQFADFLKRAMGEIAAAFIALFKVTSRPPMNKVPGTGEIQLDQVEVNNQPLPYGTTTVGSRVRYLMGKLTDSQIQEAINAAWAEAAVWNGDYTYEVFIRPDSIDKTSTVLRYEFIVGTKGL